MKKNLAIIFALLVSINTYSQSVNGIIVSDSANIKLVKVWGTHYERGYAYGSLLGDDITDIMLNYLKPSFGIFYGQARNIISNTNDLKFDSIYVTEADALIDGMNNAGTNTANFDYIDILLANSFLDLANLLGSKFGQGCSSLMNWGDATSNTSLAGKSVISRHLDWNTDSYLTSNQVICVHIPSETDEQPWLSIGFSGQISVLSGVNKDFGAFQHMMSDFSGTCQHGQQYEPIWFTLRKALEKKDFNNDGNHNVQDVKDAILPNINGYAEGYIISALARSTELSDSLIAVVAELSPQYPMITFRNNNYADSIPGDNLYTANNQIARNDAMNFCYR